MAEFGSVGAVIEFGGRLASMALYAAWDTLILIIRQK